MANSTIYPYGTGGYASSGNGIVNDLKTGGADKALSAAMGKLLGNLAGNPDQVDAFNIWNKTVLIYNPYKGRPVNAYKGQLHCHTTNSDGADSPATEPGWHTGPQPGGQEMLTQTPHTAPSERT